MRVSDVEFADYVENSSRRIDEILEGIKTNVNPLQDLDKEDINFKSTRVPALHKTICEKSGCSNPAKYIATVDSTNSLWYLCGEDTVQMKRGEVWW